MIKVLIEGQIFKKHKMEEKIINLNFGEAIEALNAGRMVARVGWNGKGMFIYKTVGNTVDKDFIPKFASLPISVKTFLENRGLDVVFNSSITMFTAAGEMQPGWLASQADMLATDWCIVYVGKTITTAEKEKLQYKIFTEEAGSFPIITEEEREEYDKQIKNNRSYIFGQGDEQH